MKASIRLLPFLLILTSTGLATQAQSPDTWMCRYEQVFVPCVPLKKIEDAAGAHLRFRFATAIPMWPSDAIFGGQVSNKDSSWDINFALKGADVPRGRDIRSLSLDTRHIDEEFADYDFLGRGAARLTITTDVLFGEQVFGLWMSAISKGVLCGKELIEQNTRVAHCAFARRKEAQTAPGRDANIEYCYFDKSFGVSGEPLCIGVARAAANGTKWVLASVYAFNGGSDGGAEEGLTCEFPENSVTDVKDRFGHFFAEYLGRSRNYRVNFNEGQYVFNGEGLKIYDDGERVYKRVHVMGWYSGRKEWVPDSETVRQLSGAEAYIGFSMTISALHSDSIIDYREPNAAMSNRLRNSMTDTVKTFSNGISRKSKCKEH